MTRIVLVSDSHRERSFLEVLPRLYPQAGYFFHCGDSELTRQEMSGWAAVEGNCDRYNEFPRSLVLEIDGLRFLLVHGHTFPRPLPRYLAAYAKQCGCQVVCFGHTHRMADMVVDGVHLLNPGSLRFNRDGRPAGYMLLELQDGQVQARALPYQQP